MTDHDRNQDLFLGILSGESGVSVAKRLGLSAERARQIFSRLASNCLSPAYLDEGEMKPPGLRSFPGPEDARASKDFFAAKIVRVIAAQKARDAAAESAAHQRAAEKQRKSDAMLQRLIAKREGRTADNIEAAIRLLEQHGYVVTRSGPQ